MAILNLAIPPAGEIERSGSCRVTTVLDTPVSICFEVDGKAIAHFTERLSSQSVGVTYDLHLTIANGILSGDISMTVAGNKQAAKVKALVDKASVLSADVTFGASHPANSIELL